MSVLKSFLVESFVDVKIKGWLELTSEQRDECIAKLRRIERSRSRSWCTPIASPYNPNDPEEVEKDLRVEREAYEELFGDNGRPCYPIELGLEVFNNPGQYKEIFGYWQDYESGAGETTERWVFFRQLKRWKLFRQFQQRNRHYFVFYNRFPNSSSESLNGGGDMDWTVICNCLRHMINKASSTIGWNTRTMNFGPMSV
ncbi:MAG: hypothetical protein LQ341_003792 [Variospora aurantia]|nr:MAG: hypothetical protein LQ341_003792 [Variospora aurantia]